MIETYEVIDNVSADSLEVGDQVIVNDDLIEITYINETDDIDEVLIGGYSHTTGDLVEYGLFADDYFDLWSV